MAEQEHYPVRNGKHCIEMKLKQLKQLFSTHDPAPFRERDLEDDAVEYIVQSLKELTLASPARLVIYLPPNEMRSDTKEETTQAIHNYFSYEEEITRKKLKILFRQGQLYFVIGLIFLSTCLYGSYYVLSGTDSIMNHILGEGLNIIGWVAMWRPLEMFLYDWRPLSRVRKYYQKLMSIEVQIVQDPRY